MTGSCIEDVNHEIYGGLYAQQIFGESFEEPPISGSPLLGWAAFGGEWRVDTDGLHVEADAGAKLVCNTVSMTDGTVEGDLRLADAAGGNASLLVRVTDPHTGADDWNGYEIAISAHDQNVTIHRHHHDWNLLKAEHAAIAPGKWVHVRVEMTGPGIRVFLGGDTEPAVSFTDARDPLLNGSIGVRTWQSDASFRDVRAAAAGEQTRPVSMSPARSDAGQVSGMWKAVHTGDLRGGYRLDTLNPYNSLQSQRIEATAGGAGTLGVANLGLNKWGIAFRQGQKFAGHLYLRQSGYAGAVTVALQSADGAETYARSRLTAITGEWKRFDFTLTSSKTYPKGRFAVWIDRPGTIWVDQVSLFPTGSDLFHGLPIRADIANALKREGVRFLRYGGTMVNAPTYKFKSMLGDRDKRPQVRGTWYAHATNGFGIEEFVQFCQAAGIEPAFAINIEETAEDAADLVEYINGPADSPWGQKRAANGHPAPYGVHYIEIGNEEALDGNKDWYRRYLERFKVLEPAMHAKDPKLQLVIAAWWRPEEPICREIAQAAEGKAALWDVHVGGDGLRDGDDVENEMTRMQAKLQEWTPGSTLKACIFEENGGRHDLQRAIGHAHILNVTERHGDFIEMDCPANCLQALMQNDNGWDQGQLFYTADKVWGMPPYYAQQMAASNYLAERVESSVQSPDRDLDVTVTRSENRKTLVLKIVNVGMSAHKAVVTLDGMPGGAVSARAQVWTLSGKLTDVNSPSQPMQTVPSVTRIGGIGRKFEVELKPYSYTLYRLSL